MLKSREVLLAKIEGTYGVDSSPTQANDAVLVENLTWAFEGARMVERAPLRASIAALKPIFAGTLMQVSFDVEVKGSGAAGTAPEIGPILRACGFGETVVPATSVTYKPVSTGHESVTLYYYQDGVLHKILGARGNVSFNMEVGNVVKASFTLTGHYSATTDTAMVTPTYDSTVPVPALGLSSLQIDGYGAVIRKLSLDMGNAVSMPGDITAADGYDDIIITARKATGSIDPNAVLKATYDWLLKWQQSAAAAVATGVLGSTAGNRIALSLPAITYTEIAKADADGLTTYEVNFMCAESTGDDEVSLAFT